jgi:hypothetical protein
MLTPGRAHRISSGRQLRLPHVRTAPTTTEIREMVRARLRGFELRQAARAAKRRKLAERNRRAQ